MTRKRRSLFTPEQLACMELLARAGRRLPEKLQSVVTAEQAPYVLRALYDYELDHPRLPAARHRKLVRAKKELEALLVEIKANPWSRVARRRRGPAPAAALDLTTRLRLAAEYAQRTAGVAKGRPEILKTIAREHGYPYRMLRRHITGHLRLP